MKIYRVEQPDGNFVETVVPDPIAKAGEVLVRVRASGVNPLDTKIRAGQAAHAKQPLPAVLGLDMAGVVEEAGEGVTAFKRGDEVYGMTGGVGGLQGSLAEFVAADANLLPHKPKRLSMRESRGSTGHVLSCLGWGSHSLAPLSFRGATYSGVFTLLPLITGEGRAHHGEILAAAAKLADEGKLTPLLSGEHFDASTISQAHSLVASGSLGKVVVEL